MKKIWKYAILLVALSALLCMSAFAAEELPVFTAEDGVAVEATEMQADRFTLTYTKTGLSGECLILMITQEEAAPASEEPQYTINENTIQYVNQDAAEGSVSFNIYPKEMVDAVILMASKDGIQKLGTVKAPEKAGVTVSGTVTSYLNDTDTVTVELWADGATEAAYTASGTGMTYAYSITGVASGTYTMKVSKTNHVTREYTITVGETAVTRDVKIHLRGDVNGDGKANAIDKRIIYNHMNDASKALTGYEFRTADINADDKVNAVDKRMLYNHMNDASKALW